MTTSRFPINYTVGTGISATGTTSSRNERGGRRKRTCRTVSGRREITGKTYVCRRRSSGGTFPLEICEIIDFRKTVRFRSLVYRDNIVRPTIRQQTRFVRRDERYGKRVPHDRCKWPLTNTYAKKKTEKRPCPAITEISYCSTVLLRIFVRVLLSATRDTDDGEHPSNVRRCIRS